MVRSGAPGCFIELDALSADGTSWSTDYCWNYAIMEDCQKRDFTLPEADVEALVKLQHDLRVLLDVRARDFGEVADRVSGVVGTANRAELCRCIAAKNKDLVDFARGISFDPVLFPTAAESACSVNVLCSPLVDAYTLVLCRPTVPVMSFRDSPLGAAYVFFALGPPGTEARCTASAVAFAALMCDATFEQALNRAESSSGVAEAIEAHLDNIVVVPHTHMHPGGRRRNNKRRDRDGSPSTRYFGSGGSLDGEGSLDGDGSVGGGAVDVLSQIVKGVISDADAANATSSLPKVMSSGSLRNSLSPENGAGDRHFEDHSLAFHDDMKGHWEMFVEMAVIGGDNVRRIAHRWHNALVEDAVRPAKGVAYWEEPHLPHESASGMLEAVELLREGQSIFLEIPGDGRAALYAAGRVKLVESMTGSSSSGGMANVVPLLPADLSAVTSAVAGASADSAQPTMSLTKAHEASVALQGLAFACEYAEPKNSPRSPMSPDFKLFMETDHSWAPEAMEILAIHSAAVPPGQRYACLLRLVRRAQPNPPRTPSGSGEDPIGENKPDIRWLFCCVGAPSEAARTETLCRAMGLFFASDDVVELCDTASTPFEVLAALHGFTSRACVVPRRAPHHDFAAVDQAVGQAAAELEQRRPSAERPLPRAAPSLHRMSSLSVSPALSASAARAIALWRRARSTSMDAHTRKRTAAAIAAERSLYSGSHAPWHQRAIAVAQKYSLPLLVGVVGALVHANADLDSYIYLMGIDHHGSHLDLTPGFDIMDHAVTIHFLVNDIFMCFFFGLAAKEVTEALLPGGGLNPINKALSPLLATVGGVVGPIAVYLACVLAFFAMGWFDDIEDCGEEADDGHRRLGGARHFLFEAAQRVTASSGDDHGDDHGDCPAVSLATVLGGWGVPTATDISLAWMVARVIFGLGHKAIGYLLLLAVVDDGLGLVIIAVFYPDPANPVQGQWLPLVPAGMAVAYGLRRWGVQRWEAYVFLAGPISWFGFLLSHVHPALALVPIVPFLPATFPDTAHGTAANYPVVKSRRKSAKVAPGSAMDDTKGTSDTQSPRCSSESRDSEATANDRGGGAPALSLSDHDDAAASEETKADPHHDAHHSGGGGGHEGHGQSREHHKHPALHQLEHDLKLFVDMGMFFFAFANAGVVVSPPGGLTLSIIFALMVGKTVGIAGFAIAGDRFLGVPLPDGVSMGDLFLLAFIAAMGLTVALFVAGEAFTHPDLVGQAKMGALLSAAVGPMAVGIGRLTRGNGPTQFQTKSSEMIARKLVLKLRAKQQAALGGVPEHGEGEGGDLESGGGGLSTDRSGRSTGRLSTGRGEEHVLCALEEVDEAIVQAWLLRILRARHESYEQSGGREGISPRRVKVEEDIVLSDFVPADIK